MSRFRNKVQPVRGRRFITALFVLLAASPAIAQQNDWKPARIWIAGGKDHVWVVASNRAKTGDTEGELRIWRADAKSLKSSPVPLGVSPIVVGGPMEVSADGDGLKILYGGDWTARSYTVTAERPLLLNESISALWKQQSTQPPLAWAGDDTQPITFAIVRTASLVTPALQSGTGGDATNSNESAKQDDARPAWLAPHQGDTTVPSTRHTLLMLRRGIWQRFEFSKEADDVGEFWLAARNEQAFLFWRNDESALYHSTFSAGQWSKSESIIAPKDIQMAWTGLAAAEPVLIAGVGPDARSLQLHPIARQSDGSWKELGAARVGSDYLTIDGLTAGVGTAMGRIAVARPGDRDQVEFAWSDKLDSPALQFAPLPARVEPVPTDPSLRTLIIPAVVLAVMSLLLLSRREQILRPAAVPAGYSIAPVWKRVLATIVDFMPAWFAVFILSLVRWDSLGFPRDPRQLLELIQSNDPTINEKMLPLQLAGIAVYGLWCLIWELATGSTLGKRMLGCRVLGVDGRAPERRQIAIRNVVRVMMVSLGTPGLLITFLTMIMLTRNCQRLGDVLAGTIVVQLGPPGPIPIARPRDSNQDDNTGR